MGKKNKKIDRARSKQSQQVQKDFIYKSYTRTKSVMAVQLAFAKAFPWTRMPTEAFIRDFVNSTDTPRMKVKEMVKQKKLVKQFAQSFGSLESTTSTSNSDQTPSSSCLNVNNNSKKKNKKRKRGNVLHEADSTVQDKSPPKLVDTTCGNVRNTVHNTNTVQNNSDNKQADKMINNIPVITLDDTHPEPPKTTLINVDNIIDLDADGNDCNVPSIYTDVTLIQRLPDTNDVKESDNVMHVSSTVPANSEGLHSTTLRGIQRDVSAMFHNLKKKRRPRHKKKSTGINKTIQKNNMKIDFTGRFQSMKNRNSNRISCCTNKENSVAPKFELKNDLINFPQLPAPSCSKSINNIKYPESSTPCKHLKLNADSKISISPIRVTQHFNKASTDVVPKFETILEISDDEDNNNEFVTIDKTGFVAKKSGDTVISLDDVSGEELRTSQDVTVIAAVENKCSEDNIDLTERPDIVNEPKAKPKVEVCYDLTADDSDLSLNKLDRRRQDLLNAIARSGLGDCYKPMVKKNNRNFGSNIYNPLGRSESVRKGLRMIVIDGSNVAVNHGMRKIFSVEGLQICIDYFLKRGHEVKAFVPRFRSRMKKSSNPRLLNKLEEAGHVVYTPSREIRGKHITSYDDRFIVQCAAEYGGVIVSGDNFRDLLQENPSWRQTIEERLLNFTWVGNLLMFPQDPLGRGGPDLQTFLSHPK